MDLDVLAADVRQRYIVAMRFRFQDQSALALVTAVAEEAGSEMQAQLHWHIETRYPRRTDLDPRKIVDAPVAFTDHSGDLADPDLGAVGLIECAPGVIA